MPSLLAEPRREWSLMIFCARATRGRPSTQLGTLSLSKGGLPSLGRMARPGVPVGWAGDNVARSGRSVSPTPGEKTSTLGRSIYIARCSQTRTTSLPCWSSRDARPGKGLVRRPHVDHRGLPCFFNSFIRHHKPRVCRNYPSKERGSSLWEEPLLCCRQKKKRSVPCCYVTITSTRRFMARPASVLLLAMGLLSPWPAADKLVLTPPSRNARAAL